MELVLDSTPRDAGVEAQKNVPRALFLGSKAVNRRHMHLESASLGESGLEETAMTRTKERKDQDLYSVD